MLFGQSLFESVLTRLEEEQPVVEEAQADAPRIRGLSTGFVAPAFEGVSVSLHRIDGAYLDLSDETLQAPVEDPEPIPEALSAPPPLPAHLARQLPAEIAEDLGLTPSDSVEMLGERRRLFARQNHPDVVHPAHREAANLRMMTANLLIDQAISRLLASRRLGLL